MITTNERTARWAARPIDLGRTQGMLRPLVIGPDQIPRTLALQEARACPELATLAVLVHGHRPGRSRGLVTTAAQLRRIESCTDSRQLHAWLRRAAVAESAVQLFPRRASG